MPFGSVGRQNSDDVINAARDAAGKISGLEAWRDGVRDDDFRERIGEGPLQPVTHLDANSPLVRRDQEHHAVVLALLAELPATKQLVGVGFNLLAFEGPDGGNDELDAGLRLQIGKLLFERAAGLGRDNVGLINDSASQRWEGEADSGGDGALPGLAGEGLIHSCSRVGREGARRAHQDVPRRQVRISLAAASARCQSP